MIYIYIYIYILLCVCVNRSPDCAIWPNYEVVELQPQSVVTTVLDSVAYCYLLLPYLPFYSIPHLRSHTRSSAHPGIACLRTRISAYRTRSNANPGVSCLRPSILTTRYAYLPYPSPYCATLPSRRLQLLASCENSSRVSCSCLSAASWRPLRIPYCLHILPILVAKRPNAPRLPSVSICRTYFTAFPLLTALLTPRVSTMSCPLAVALVSPWSAAENTCVFLRPSAPLPPKLPKYIILYKYTLNWC